MTNILFDSDGGLRVVEEEGGKVRVSAFDRRQER